MRKTILILLITVPSFLFAQTNKEKKEHLYLQKQEKEAPCKYKQKVAPLEFDPNATSDTIIKPNVEIYSKRISVNVKKNTEQLKLYKDEKH